MKRLAGLLLILGLAAGMPALFAQEEKKAAESAGEENQGHLALWKWANFAVLAGAIGYLAGKNAGPFFSGRARQIRKEMIEAEDVRKDAEARAAEVDRRLGCLEADIAQLRAESEKEATAEQERLRQATIAELAKIEAHAQQEIASAGKAARMELKRYAAQLAIEMAERQISAGMSPDAQENLLRAFVRDLDSPASRAQTT